MSHHMYRLLTYLTLTGLGLALLILEVAASPVASLSGTVAEADGSPVSGATVRIRASDNVTTTDTDGKFTLSGLDEGQQVEVTAWADGYYTASALVTPSSTGLVLTLRLYHSVDNSDYEWAAPSVCDSCHPMLTLQWTANAHGGAVSNPRFFSLYNGTDISGTAVVAPGYMLDFPGTTGNCANCHAPGAGVDGFSTTDMNQVRGETAAGIHCDYCHKIGGVYINPATGTVYPNMPGALSQRMLRPPTGEDIFFGPYDDIPDPDTYLAEMEQSQYCAPCHQFSFWGTPIYESYNEWLNSPYAEAGVTCQACHMPPNGDNYFALPEMDGLWHPAERIPSHLDLGLKDIGFMTGTVGMTVTADMIGNAVVVNVVLENVAAGHHVPTDHPGRHLILTVAALDENGQPLPLILGDTVPAWGGEQAGMPGKAFAKVLEDALTGDFPVVSYWKQTFVASDNRIPALSSDISIYSFTAPSGGNPVTVTAELRFRRSFEAEMEARGWDDADIVMAEKTLFILPGWEIYLPVIGR
jgi:hypothetical protein